MRRTAVVCAGVLALVLAVCAVDAVSDDDGVVAVEIQVSPNVIVLKSVAASDDLTVHTNLRFSLVDRSTVELTVSGTTLPARGTFADNCGNLVAKFSLGQVKELVAPPSAVLTLSGLLNDGAAFSGSATVGVK